MPTITKDRALALAMLIMVAILYVESGNIRPPTSWQTYGSAMFPQILLGVIAILSVLILLRSLFNSKSSQAHERRTAMQWLKKNGVVLSLFALFGLYALVLPVLGYLVSTMAFMVASLALLLGVDTRRKWIINLGVSVTLASLIYVTFHFGLNIWLP
ncbi:tripartite tricarboxylate transporter TctB family protein [Halomonas cupida]|uniref:tripartite tricarboxylate transporter TctB family protein n=1 Tax=Halomonas cupida TaxID=44933 RepID=UPI003A937603